MPDYIEYSNNSSYMKLATKYQQRYISNRRETDKVTLKHIEKYNNSYELKKLLDIGCGAGGIFLKAIRDLYPKISLIGTDLSEEIIKENTKINSEFRIKFIHDDFLNPNKILPKSDILTMNAVFMFFNEEEIQRAFDRIFDQLTEKGLFIALDYMHPWDQKFSIIEHSKLHPEGLLLHFYNYSFLENCLKRSGFRNVNIEPFEMPFELPFKDYNSIQTHTLKTKDNCNLSFRGAIYQPWAHLTAQK